MGLLGRSLAMISPRRASQLATKQAAAAYVPPWQTGMMQFPNATYQRMALDGYGKNELVYACIEELCSSASEPRIAAYLDGEPEPERVMQHPSLDVLNHPNPFLSRYAFMSGIILYRYLAGNVYIEKVRSRSGGVAELWLLRPDRMRVIPAGPNFIAGYEYRIGPQTFRLPPNDVIHIKTNNPIDDFYGMPPLAAAMQRVDTDNWMRQYMASFFANAGMPAGMLIVKETLEEEDREAINLQYRQSFGGAAGWHGLMVVSGEDVQYQQLGQSPGPRGLAAPDLDEITEARIPMVFGVPEELIGARLGMIHGNRSTMREARAGFWDETLAPLYVEIAEALTAGLIDEYPSGEVDYWAFDYSQVKALQEDDDAKHKRVREDMLAGMITVEEAREETGREAEFDPSHTLMLGSGITPYPVPQALGAGGQSQPDANANPAGADGQGGDNSPDFPDLAALAVGSTNGRAH